MNYQGPVIDTHHHLWLREYISWLQDPAAPHMAGDLFGIRTDYPVEEWMRDVVPAGVVKSVHVTANWGVEKSLSETKWLQSISDLHGFPNAIVFQADMTDTNLESKIKEHLQYPNVRGVRHQIHWDDTLKNNIDQSKIFFLSKTNLKLYELVAARLCTKFCKF
jgi:predicted TIM-barrel fold metal-dependent hydrolase